VAANLGGEGLVDEGLLDGDPSLTLLETLTESLVADGGNGAFGAWREGGRIAVEVAPVRAGEALPRAGVATTLGVLDHAPSVGTQAADAAHVAEDRLLAHVAPTTRWVDVKCIPLEERRQSWEVPPVAALEVVELIAE